MIFGSRFADRKDVNWHSHDAAELVLVTEGECSCRVGEVTLPGKAGILWVLPPDVPQYVVNRTFSRTIYVGFTDPAFDSSARAIEVGLEGFVRRWLEDLIDLHKAGRGEAGHRLMGALLAEISHIESGARTTAGVPEDVRDAIAWLEQRVNMEVTAEQLADHVHLSSSRLATLFRQSVGCPPLQYQQRLRLRQAERLLRDPHLSVKQVAAACGYVDCNYFVRLFRKRYGRPPGEWRR